MASWVQSVGIKMQDLGFVVGGVSDLGVPQDRAVEGRAPGFGFRVSGFGFRVSGFGFRV